MPGVIVLKRLHMAFIFSIYSQLVAFYAVIDVQGVLTTTTSVADGGLAAD